MRTVRPPISMCLRLLLAAAIALPAVLPQIAAAQPPATAAAPAGATVVRNIPLARHGVTNPEGLAYSPDSGVFLLSQAADAGTEQLTVAAVTPFDDLAATTNMAIGVADPVNSAVDAGRNRLLLLDSQAQQLIEADIDLEGRVLPETMSRTSIGGLALSDARGLYVDPDTSNLYILDNGARQIVVVRPGGEQSYGDTLAAGADQPSRISLAPLGNASLRGIAVHPLTGHLFVLGSEQARMYELAATGELIATYDLAHLGISAPRALIIARSADLTDAPTEMHVYVVDGGAHFASPPTGANRLYLPGIFGGTNADTDGLETSTQARLVELTLEVVPDLMDAAVEAATAAPLLRTIDTSPFPAPDPSGIAYNSSTNRLVVSDAEVEEMAIYAGNNVYETSLSGNLQRSSNTIAFSSEPTGAAYNPLNDHMFFSDDDKKKVNEVDPKADGLINTGDDVRTSFDTSAFDSMDPEGVAYSPALNMIFIADGVNAEVYKVAPGPNGLFDGTDDVVTHFDTESLGITDPEGIEWNPDSGTLYIVGKPRTAIGELTTNGAVVRMHDISAANAYKPAGLAYGPASQNSSLRSIYIVDRNVDNASDPKENDGKIYEMSLGSVTPGNQAPVVNAGADQTITQAQAATLPGSITDDGIPNPPGSVSAAWTKVSGPGTVTFANAGAASTTATFSSVGTYVLRLSANDGELVSSDEVTVIVTSVNGQATTQVRITTSSDDAEQRTSGSVSLTSPDLQLTTYNGDVQVVGLRFPGVEVPRGATIVDANIQFMADEASTVATNLTIFGQDAGNPATFTSASNSISTRPRTAASVAWAPPTWPTVGAAGADQKTPPLTNIVQSLTDRSDWSAGNAMVFIITGTGSRVAESSDGNPASGAPLLTITYRLATNAAPSVNAGADQTIALPASAALDGTVSDDGLPNPPGSVTATWSKVSGPGTVTFGNANAVDTTASFSAAGIYVLRLSAGDSSLSASDEIQVTVNEQTGSVAVDVRISVGSDDAEQRSTNSVSISNGDLELVDDGGIQTVGLRFPSLAIPRGATILNAYVQFKADERTSEATSLVLQAEASDNAQTFRSASLNVSSRPRTSESVNWSPVAWSVIGAAGLEQRTPDLSNVIRAVINRPGWSSGNALAIIVTGSGRRVAESYEGDPAGAPLLHVDYVVSTQQAPVVDAGPNQTVVLPNTATLLGTVNDDGLPNPPGAVSITWSQVSGPGTTTIAQPNSATTEAAFSTAGTYVLRLAASDSWLTSYDDVTVEVQPNPLANQAPLVDAGPDQTVLLPASATLNATVSDDGRPNGMLVVQWSVVSGSGTVTFADPAAIDTAASFSAPGTYVLRLTADDDELTTSEDVTIVVLSSSGTVVLEQRIITSYDDVEEKDGGNISRSNGDLELTFDGVTQTVGMRFTSIPIPRNSQIVAAYVQFKTDESTSETTTLTIQGQAAGNAAAFTGANFNLTSRPRTAAAVAWSPPAWPIVGEAAVGQRTPNINVVVQEIVNNTGWASGNALVIVISGSGRRVAESYDGDAAGAPLLVVEYIPAP